MRHHDYQVGILARTKSHIHDNCVTVPSVGYPTFCDNEMHRYGAIFEMTLSACLKRVETLYIPNSSAKSLPGEMLERPQAFAHVVRDAIAAEGVLNLDLSLRYPLFLIRMFTNTILKEERNTQQQENQSNRGKPDSG